MSASRDRLEKFHYTKQAFGIINFSLIRSVSWILISRFYACDEALKTIVSQMKIAVNDEYETDIQTQVSAYHMLSQFPTNYSNTNCVHWQTHTSVSNVQVVMIMAYFSHYWYNICAIGINSGNATLLWDTRIVSINWYNWIKHFRLLFPSLQ